MTVPHTWTDFCQNAVCPALPMHEQGSSAPVPWHRPPAAPISHLPINASALDVRRPSICPKARPSAPLRLQVKNSGDAHVPLDWIEW